MLVFQFPTTVQETSPVTVISAEGNIVFCEYGLMMSKEVYKSQLTCPLLTT